MSHLRIPSKFVVLPFLINPQIRRHDLILLIHVQKLRESERHFHGEFVAVVADRANEFVVAKTAVEVATKQVVVEALRIRVGRGRWRMRKSRRESREGEQEVDEAVGGRRRGGRGGRRERV